MDYKKAFKFFKEQGYNVTIDRICMAEKTLEIFAFENGYRPMHFQIFINEQGNFAYNIR